MSGLLHPSRGQVFFDGVDVTKLPTERRHIAQVFQFPVTYDSMSVFDNLAFPLRNRGRDVTSIRHRVAEVAEALGLTGRLSRRAGNLSAELKQLISLGRGLVRDDVAAILFDEPLTMVDPELKWKLRMQLKRLHQQFAHTMIYVTHDQAEALSFADTVAVMSEGRIVQAGTPQELFERPAHTFVGYFIGSPGMNVLPATVRGTAASIEGCSIRLARRYGQLDGDRVEIGVRPEFVTLGRREEADDNGLPVELKRIEDVGKYRVARTAFHGHELNVVIPEGVPISADANFVTFDSRYINVYVDGAVSDGVACA